MANEEIRREWKHAGIKKEWEEYYKTLEGIRRSGVTNMFGAAPYLMQLCDIDEKLAREVLVNWMQNYNELSKLYKWER